MSGVFETVDPDSGLPVIGVPDPVPSATPATGQALQASLVQQSSQMAGRGRLGYFRHCLILRGADSLLEPSFAAIQQAIQNPGLLGRKPGFPMRLPEPRLALLEALARRRFEAHFAH